MVAISSGSCRTQSGRAGGACRVNERGGTIRPPARCSGHALDYARRMPSAWTFDNDGTGDQTMRLQLGPDPPVRPRVCAGVGRLCGVERQQGRHHVEHVRDVPVDYLYDRCLSSEERSEVRVREASAARERLAELWALKQALRNAADLSGRVSPSTIRSGCLGACRCSSSDPPASASARSISRSTSRPQVIASPSRWK